MRARLLVAFPLVAAGLLAGCATRPFLVTAKPINIGTGRDGVCLAIPTKASEPLKYWDPGKDCSERFSSVGEAQVVTEGASRSGERTIRFDVPLHVGVAHVSLQVTADRVRCPQTGGEQALQELSAIPASDIDRYLTR
jgi:hypothetical protein